MWFIFTEKHLLGSINSIGISPVRRKTVSMEGESGNYIPSSDLCGPGRGGNL